MPSFRAKVTGRVQGVGYRFFVQRKAAALALGGYAKNLPDGGVDVAAEGPREKLIELALELKKGPPLSKVDDVQVLWGDAGQGYKDFSIRY